MQLYENLGHGKPLTRRELLSRSVQTVSAAAVMPSLLGLLGQATAHAEEGPSFPAFLVFDLAGGAALPGNFLAARNDDASQLLASYSTLGWDPRETGAVDASFGLPMAARASQMLVGMRQTAAASTLANLRFGSFCHSAQADSPFNRSSILTMVAGAGATGTKIISAVGMQGTDSGSAGASLVDAPSLKPLQVQSLDTFLQALAFGPALQALPPSVLATFTQAAVALNQAQSRKLAAYANGEQLAVLSGGRYQEINAAALANAADPLDPRRNPIFQKIYGIDTATSASAANAVIAGIVMNTLNGNAGPGAVTIGGCDYHTNAQKDGDGKDLEIGQQLGRAVEAAAQLKKPLFIQIFTDGGIAAVNGSRDWSADTNDSMTIVGYFDPSGPRKQRVLQIGSYTDGQIAKRDTAIGVGPEIPAYGAFANYLQVAGLFDRFSAFAPQFPGDRQLLTDLLIFS